MLETEYLVRSPWRDVRSGIGCATPGRGHLLLPGGPEAVFVVPLTTDGKIVVVASTAPAPGLDLEVVGWQRRRG